MTDLPVLYSFRRCPYAIRARLAIASSGRPVELREIVLRDKAPEFLKVSPSATVPCLKAGDEVIDESWDIMLWALEFADPDNWLQPEQGTVAEMQELVLQCDGPFKSHLDRYKYHVRYEDADREKERALAGAFLTELDERLRRGPWLFGGSASLADYAILPFVRQFANADRVWFDAQDWRPLRSWLESFEASGTFQAVMPKWTKWVSGDTPVRFPA
ncbi:glutathione S-transferase [Roseibium sp.]|uniref:glutathione S-transferase n=1 Tax=Roseibium sp. TaxID=1936156 RepID=UPI003BA9B9E4